MLPSNKLREVEEDLVADSSSHRDPSKTTHFRDSSQGYMSSESGLISRDGVSQMTSRIHTVDHHLQSIGGRIDSGFDSLKSERYSSTDFSTGSSGFLHSDPKMKQETTSSVFDSGLGQSGQIDSFTSVCTEEVGNQLSNLRIRDSGIEEPSDEGITVFEEKFLQDDDGDTTLHLAIILELEFQVCNLIDYVPHVTFLNLKNNLHQTSLHLAVLTKQQRIVRKLVAAGANLEMRDRRGNTALHIACQEGSIQCAEELLRPLSQHELNRKSYQDDDLRYGLTQDLELFNYEGQMCVHLATLHNHPELLDLLCQFGADMNSKEGKSGRTPLHYAVEMKSLPLVQFLVQHCKANVHARTYAGYTPVQLCYGINQPLVDFLVSWGAENIGLPSDTEGESDSDVDETTKMETTDDDCEFYVNDQPLVA